MTIRLRFYTLFLLLVTTPIQAQLTDHFGDILFEKNKSKDSFSYQSQYNNVEIGRVINLKTKHAIVFQQIDTTRYLNQLKLITYNGDMVKETVIDTLEIGILVEFKLIDKTFDGNNDLLISLGGNRLFDLLYVYDSENNTLVKIPEFHNYPSTDRVENTDYLFTYRALGCADNLWESKLIKIEAFKVIEYGRIYGQNCDLTDNPIIDISLRDSKLKQLQYSSTLEKYPMGKFDFIKDYWRKNSTTN